MSIVRLSVLRAIGNFRSGCSLPVRPAGAILAAVLAMAGCGTSAPSPSAPAERPSGEVPAATPVAEPERRDAPAAAPESDEEIGQIPQQQTLLEPPQLLSSDELSEGWISLFDGSTLFGWHANSDANWRVAEGTIVVDQGKPGLLCTAVQFSDYVLRLDFRSDPGTNSGVFLRTPQHPTDPAVDCYELNIADHDNPFPTGSLVKRHKVEGPFDSTEWQSFEVTVEGNRVAVKLDQQPILEYDDPTSLRRGFIGLQLNQGKVAFRNIQIKPLGLKSIFNGRDLTGWKTYPDMASEFQVTPGGELHVVNGPGQLESLGAYGDFLLQLECISHSPQLNSGIFFRCIAGENMNGYESQIHNGYQDGDRSKPVDCGTGGIFRRQDARLVMADDQQWFSKTIVADGPRLATWVNGIQVVDWVDERKSDPNPRRGLRLEPGTLMIQGHDPTTDLSFRNLRIVELP